MNNATHLETAPMHNPYIETQPGMRDMAAFEATFAAPAYEPQPASVQEQQEDMQMQVGFNPVLLGMFLRAEQGSAFAKNIEKAMMVDMIVNNAVAYNIVTPYDTEMTHQREEEKKKKEAKLA